MSGAYCKTIVVVTATSQFKPYKQAASELPARCLLSATPGCVFVLLCSVYYSGMGQRPTGHGASQHQSDAKWPSSMPCGIPFCKEESRPQNQEMLWPLFTSTNGTIGTQTVHTHKKLSVPAPNLEKSLTEKKILCTTTVPDTPK
eukprot:2831774-Amphidinium_carterae.1